jgi:hypothetical protein
MKQYLIRITYDSKEYAEAGTTQVVTETFLVDGAERILHQENHNNQEGALTCRKKGN